MRIKTFISRAIRFRISRESETREGVGQSPVKRDGLWAELRLV